MLLNSPNVVVNFKIFQEDDWNVKERKGSFYLEDEAWVHGQAQISSYEFIFVPSQ